jgi:hypothetical protein
MKAMIPKPSRAADFPIQMPGTTGFQSINHSVQRNFTQLQEQVNMIWHDHPTQYSGI